MTAAPTDRSPTRTRRRLHRLLLGALLTLVLLLTVVAVLGPRLLSAAAPSIIAGRIEREVAGDVRIGRVALSWTGPQRIEALTITLPDGHTPVDVSADASFGLLDLIRGSRDLGTITLRGRASITADASGSPTLLRPSATPAPSAADGPPALPANLRADLQLNGFDLEYLPAEAPGLRLVDLDGGGAVIAGQPIQVDLTGEAPDIDGDFTLKGRLRDLINAEGQLTPDRVALDADLASDFDPRKLSAMLGATLPAQDGLPERVSLTMRGKGGVESISFALTAEAPNASETFSASAEGTLTPDRLRLDGPAEAALTTSPEMARALGLTSKRFDLLAPVRADVDVRRLELPLRNDRSIDFRGARVDASLETSELRARLTPPDAAARSVRIKPVVATLRSDDIAESIALEADADALIDDTNAGRLSLRLTMTPARDGAGVRFDMLPQLDGSFDIEQADAALLDPFTDRRALAILRDIGPTFDARLTASTAGAGASHQGDALRRTQFDATFTSRNLSATLTASLDADRIRSRGEGLRIEARSPDAAITALAADLPLRLAASDPITFTSRSFDIPLAGARALPSRAQAAAEMTIGGLTLRDPKRGGEITARGGALVVTLSPDQPPSLGLDAPVRINGQMARATADVSLPGLFTPDGAIDIEGARLAGDASVSDVPLQSLRPYFQKGYTRDVLDALADRRADVRIDLDAPEAESSADIRAQRARIRAEAGDLTADADILLTPGASFSGGASAEILATSQLLDAVRPALPEFARDAALAAPVRLSASLDPIELPLSEADLLPDFTSLDALTVNFSLKDDLALRDIRFGEGQSINAGLRSGNGAVFLPLRDGVQLDADIEGDLFNPDRPEIAAAHLVASIDQRPQGPVIRGALTDADTARLDEMLQRPGLLAGALGERADLTITSRSAEEKENAPSPIDVRVDSPRLTGGATLSLRSDRVELLERAELRWRIEPAWLRSVTTVRGGTPAPAIDWLASPMDLTLTIREAAFALGEHPLAPDVFRIEAEATAPRIATALTDQTTLNYRDARFVVSARGGSPADVLLSAASPSQESPLRLDVRISQYATPAGDPDFGAAVADGSFSGRIPSGLLDHLAGAEGRITEALGWSVDVQGSAAGLSAAGGRLRLDASSSRAQASIRGVVSGGALQLDQEASAQLNTISPQLGEMVFERILPLVGSLEKRAEDQPARLTARKLTIPLNGDLARLEGDLTLHLGEVRYEANPVFGRLLDVTGNRRESIFFDNWPRLDISIREGVVTYERVILPMGDFDLETKGSVDLVRRRVDIVTYVPLTALIDEVSRTVRNVPGVGRIAQVPLRTRGAFGSLKTEPAIDLLLRETIRSPFKFIDDVLKTIEGERRR